MFTTQTLICKTNFRWSPDHLLNLKSKYFVPSSKRRFSNSVQFQCQHVDKMMENVVFKDISNQEEVVAKKEEVLDLAKKDLARKDLDLAKKKVKKTDNLISLDSLINKKERKISLKVFFIGTFQLAGKCDEKMAYVVVSNFIALANCKKHHVHEDDHFSCLSSSSSSMNDPITFQTVMTNVNLDFGFSINQSSLFATLQKFYPHFSVYTSMSTHALICKIKSDDKISHLTEMSLKWENVEQQICQFRTMKRQSFPTNDSKTLKNNQDVSVEQNQTTTFSSEVLAKQPFLTEPPLFSAKPHSSTFLSMKNNKKKNGSFFVTFSIYTSGKYIASGPDMETIFFFLKEFEQIIELYKETRKLEENHHIKKLQNMVCNINKRQESIQNTTTVTNQCKKRKNVFQQRSLLVNDFKKCKQAFSVKEVLSKTDQHSYNDLDREFHELTEDELAEEEEVLDLAKKEEEEFSAKEEEEFSSEEEEEVLAGEEEEEEEEFSAKEKEEFSAKEEEEEEEEEFSAKEEDQTIDTSWNFQNNIFSMCRSKNTTFSSSPKNNNEKVDIIANSPVVNKKKLQSDILSSSSSHFSVLAKKGATLAKTKTLKTLGRETKRASHSNHIWMNKNDKKTTKNKKLKKNNNHVSGLEQVFFPSFEKQCKKKHIVNKMKQSHSHFLTKNHSFSRITGCDLQNSLGNVNNFKSSYENKKEGFLAKDLAKDLAENREKWAALFLCSEDCLPTKIRRLFKPSLSTKKSQTDALPKNDSCSSISFPSNHQWMIFRVCRGQKVYVEKEILKHALNLESFSALSKAKAKAKTSSLPSSSSFSVIPSLPGHSSHSTFEADLSSSSFSVLAKKSSSCQNDSILLSKICVDDYRNVRLFLDTISSTQSSDRVKVVSNFFFVSRDFFSVDSLTSFFNLVCSSRKSRKNNYFHNNSSS